MAQPHDPKEVDQTLLPSEVPQTSSDPNVKPGRAEETPAQPAGSDMTIDLPSSAAATPSLDPLETLASVDHNDHFVVDATAEPVNTGAGAPGTLAEGESDAGQTMTLPGTSGSEQMSGSSGKLGSDTSPISISVNDGERSIASPSATGTMIGRFALKDLHASGGLGEVFKARDTELNREVAVKRIKSRFADDVGSRRRFLNEAELTARLDHPGVVPVFGLVNDLRGRPCYAMRFIRGETLKDEIDRYYGQQKTDEKGQKTEPEATNSQEAKTAAMVHAAGIAVPRTVAFRHLLARFIATCQAIAYAHSRNIIHRDIKPANIMVGNFGETLVVDWGLAKSLDDGPDFERLLRTSTGTGLRHDPESTDLPTHMTMAGTAVGTPAYMPPEQAAGEITKIGPRADIYSLGATLFVILTGKPPVVGKNTLEVLKRVRNGDFEPAAKVNPRCAKPLDAIVRKAMALRQEDRYASALDLAADVERWLSDEPVSCYKDPLFARLARWARRHPARVAAGVSLLLAGVLGTVGIAWAINEGRKSTQEALNQVSSEQVKTAAALTQVTEEQGRTKSALAQVTTEQAKTEEQRRKAVAARNVASERYEKAVAAYNVLVNDIDKKLADRAGMQELRKTLLLNATSGLQDLVRGGGEQHISADRTLVAAYRQMGEVYQLVGDTAKSRENFEKAVELALEVQREAAPADRRAADRDLGLSYDKLAGIHLQAGDTKAALDAANTAVSIFEELAKDEGDADAQQQLAAAKARRAKILIERGETGKAMSDSNSALALRQHLSEVDQGNLERKRAFADSLASVSELQLRTGRTLDALHNAELSLEVLKDVAKRRAEQPDAQRALAAAHVQLADVQIERGQMTSAVKEYRTGLDVLNQLVAEDEQSAAAKADLAELYGRLGFIQLRTGDIEDAVLNTKTGMELAAELQKADPDSAKARRELAAARGRYGDALLAAGRIDDAIAEYVASEKILRPLRDADKDSARARLELAFGLERLGDGLMAKKDSSGAIAAFRESMTIREQVAGKDSGSTSAKRDYAMGLYKLADAHCASGKPRMGAAFANPATDLLITLAAADPQSARTQRDIALAYGKWGQVLAAGGHPTGALIVWQSSLERCETLAKLDAGNLQAKEDEAIAWERLANFYASIGHTDRALSTAGNAVKLWTAIGNSGDAKTKAGRRRLAMAMLRCGDINIEVRQLNTARDWYKKARQEVAGFESDPLLGPVAKLTDGQQEFIDAVEAGLKNPMDVLKFPKELHAAALRMVATLEIRADHPVNASVAIAEYAKLVTTTAEKFTVARLFASCANVGPGTDDAKDAYAADAVKYLEMAIDGGFRDVDALDTSEWDAVRQRVPAYEKLHASLEKMRAEEKE